MADRVTVLGNGDSFVDWNPEKSEAKGKGATGQIKKAGLFGRSITINGTKLNRGSLIDYINANPKGEKLLKGGRFRGGASTKEIEDAYKALFGKGPEGGHASQISSVDENRDSAYSVPNTALRKVSYTPVENESMVGGLEESKREVLGKAIEAMEGKEGVEDSFFGGLMPFASVTVGESEVYLANDEIRSKLAENGSKSVVGAMNDAVKDYNKEFSDGNEAAPHLDELGDAAQIPSLIVSVNATSLNPGYGYQPQLAVDGLEHRQLPVGEGYSYTEAERSESVEVLDNYQEVLESREIRDVFDAMDAKINGGEDLIIHCSQGEHRSAALLVLYLATRSRPTEPAASFDPGKHFENCWKYVQSKRPIKPYKKKERETFMTKAFNYWKELPENKGLAQ